MNPLALLTVITHWVKAQRPMENFKRVVSISDLETVMQAAKRLGTSDSYVYRLIRKGILNTHEIAGRKLVIRTDVDILIAGRRKKQKLRKVRNGSNGGLEVSRTRETNAEGIRRANATRSDDPRRNTSEPETDERLARELSAGCA